MLTPKENILQILSGGSPEWMPACVHILNANNLPEFLPKTLLTEPLDRLAISEFVGGDILYEVFAVRSDLPPGFQLQSATHDNSRTTTIVTPQGSLTRMTAVSSVPAPDYDNLPPGCALPGPVVTSSHTKFFLETPRDYDLLVSYVKARTFSADHDCIAGHLAKVGDRGVVILGGGPPSPLYELISSFAGIERFTFDLFDMPAVLEQTVHAMQRTACRWDEAAAASPCDVVRCTEDLDTKLISPDLFRRYALPALTKYARICHRHGKLFVLHMCGHINDLLPDIVRIGADAIHCLTLPPTGNTTLAHARDILQPRTAAMIRFDPQTLLTGSFEHIDHIVSDMVSQVRSWHNVLSIIPCGRAPLQNIRRVIHQVHSLGRYD